MSIFRRCKVYKPDAVGQAGYFWGRGSITVSSSPCRIYRNSTLIFTTPSWSNTICANNVKVFGALDTVLIGNNAGGWTAYYAGEAVTNTLPLMQAPVFTAVGNYITVKINNIIVGYFYNGIYQSINYQSPIVFGNANQLFIAQKGLITDIKESALFYRDQDLTDQLAVFNGTDYSVNVYSKLIVVQGNANVQVWYQGESVQDETTIGLPSYWTTACHQWQDDSNAYVVCGTPETVNNVTTWTSFFILNPNGTIFKSKIDIEGQPVAGTENFTGTIDWIKKCELTKYNDDGTKWKDEWKYYHGNPINDTNPVLIVHTTSGHFAVLNENGDWYESRNDNFASNDFTCCGDKVIVGTKGIYTIKDGMVING